MVSSAAAATPLNGLIARAPRRAAARVRNSRRRNRGREGGVICLENILPPHLLVDSEYATELSPSARPAHHPAAARGPAAPRERRAAAGAGTAGCRPSNAG